MSDALMTNLEAWYRNNGTDRSGNGNDLTPVGSPTTTTGLSGVANAAMLAGDVGSYEGDAINLSVPFSWSVFVYVNPPPAEPAFDFVYQSLVDPLQYRQQLGLTSTDGNTVVGFFTDGNTAASGSANATGWVHLAATHDGTTARLFINGVLVNAQVYGYDFASVVEFYLGVGGEPVILQFFGSWSHALDFGGVSIGNPASDGSDVARLYNSGIGLDPTTLSQIGGSDAESWWGMNKRKFVWKPGKKKRKREQVSASVWFLQSPRK